MTDAICRDGCAASFGAPRVGREEDGDPILRDLQRHIGLFAFLELFRFTARKSLRALTGSDLCLRVSVLDRPFWIEDDLSK